MRPEPQESNKPNTTQFCTPRFEPNKFSVLLSHDMKDLKSQSFSVDQTHSVSTVKFPGVGRVTGQCPGWVWGARVNACTCSPPWRPKCLKQCVCIQTSPGTSLCISQTSLVLYRPYEDGANYLLETLAHAWSWRQQGERDVSRMLLNQNYHVAFRRLPERFWGIRWAYTFIIKAQSLSRSTENISTEMMRPASHNDLSHYWEKKS